MSTLRPAGSGAPAECEAFVRRSASPLAALVLGCDGALPGDWPTVDGIGASDAPLGHAVGYVCEIRRDSVVLLNPLGEGVARSHLPALDEGWLHQVKLTASAAVYLLEGTFGPDGGQAALLDQASAGPVTAASVRTALSDGFGAPPKVGRNDPCHCGSGKKFKRCHGT